MNRAKLGTIAWSLIQDPIVIAFLFCAIVALFDAYMLRSVFEQNGYSYIENYWYAMWTVFIPLMTLLFALAAKNLWVVPYSLVFNYMYFEDILYFLVQGSWPPEGLWWLKGNPNPPMILFQVGVGIFLVTVLRLRIRKWMKDAKKG